MAGSSAFARPRPAPAINRSSTGQAMPIANRAGGIVVGKFGTATASFEEVFA